MTFNTERQKINKLWNQNSNNTFVISNNQSRNSIIFDRVSNLNRTSEVYQNFLKIDSDWLIPDFDVEEDGTVSKFFKEFRVIFNNVSDNFLPIIQSEILYRVGDSEISAPIPDSINDPDFAFDEIADFKRNDVLEIRDENGISIVTNVSSIYLEQGDGLPEDIQVKFIFSLFNPNQFQDS